MKKNTEPIQCNRFYHIYNRGINGEDIFKDLRNYDYFLRQYAKYIQPVAETYAYCLLKNHFHLLIKTRNATEIVTNFRANVGEVLNLADVGVADVEARANKHISNQFAKLFNSYAQAVNKAHKRTGGLFEEPFRRIPVGTDAYFLELVYYIHANPQKHGFVDDFRIYPHSSYHTHLSKSGTKLCREVLLDWFGNAEGYERYHLANQILDNLSKYDIEFE